MRYERKTSRTIRGDGGKRASRIRDRDRVRGLFVRGMRADGVPLSAKLARPAKVTPRRRLSRYRPMHPQPGTKPRLPWWKRKATVPSKGGGVLVPTGVTVAYHGGYNAEGRRKPDRWA